MDNVHFRWNRGSEDRWGRDGERQDAAGRTDLKEKPERRTPLPNLRLGAETTAGRCTAPSGSMELVLVLRSRVLVK